MAGHRELGGMNREGIMSGEEGADQCMSCRGVCVGMQMRETASAMQDMSSETIVVTIRSILIGISGPSARYAYQRSQTLDWLTVAANALQRTLILPISRDKRCPVSTIVETRSSAGDCMTLNSKMLSPLSCFADPVAKACAPS